MDWIPSVWDIGYKNWENLVELELRPVAHPEFVSMSGTRRPLSLLTAKAYTHTISNSVFPLDSEQYVAYIGHKGI
jgi:hypothetical protein